MVTSVTLITSICQHKLLRSTHYCAYFSRLHGCMITCYLFSGTLHNIAMVTKAQTTVGWLTGEFAWVSEAIRIMILCMLYMITWYLLISILPNTVEPVI